MLRCPILNIWLWSFKIYTSKAWAQASLILWGASCLLVFPGTALLCLENTHGYLEDGSGAGITHTLTLVLARQLPAAPWANPGETEHKENRGMTFAIHWCSLKHGCGFPYQSAVEGWQWAIKQNNITRRAQFRICCVSGTIFKTLYGRSALTMKKQLQTTRPEIDSSYFPEFVAPVHLPFFTRVFFNMCLLFICLSTSNH